MYVIIYYLCLYIPRAIICCSWGFSILTYFIRLSHVTSNLMLYFLTSHGMLHNLLLKYLCYLHGGGFSGLVDVLWCVFFIVCLLRFAQRSCNYFDTTFENYFLYISYYLNFVIMGP